MSSEEEVVIPLFRDEYVDFIFNQFDLLMKRRFITMLAYTNAQDKTEDVIGEQLVDF